MLQRTVSKATTRDIREANELLRFAKDPQGRHADISQLTRLSLSDAAWATMSDGDNERDRFVMSVLQEAFADRATFYAVLDWTSSEQTRWCLRKHSGV